jgi:tRNA (cytidine/uridine-2'-O-)-methyltransferase
LHIVLIEPEIPGNTGNIARLCAATGFTLHLVKPLGFSVADKYLKRAGLDYWNLVSIEYHDNFQAVLDKYPNNNFYFFSSKAPQSHCDVSYTEDDFLVFGKETAGIPETILSEHWDTCVRIPMREEARCLNLSNAVAVASYEALRQLDFYSLKIVGQEAI